MKVVIEERLRVGRKGEIFTTKRIRDALNIKPGSYVVARVTDNKLVTIRIPELSEILGDYFVSVGWDGVESISEEMQRKLMEDE